MDALFHDDLFLECRSDARPDCGVSSWTPLPTASGRIDLRVDRMHRDHAVVVGVRGAGTYGHARGSWFAYDGSERSTLSLGYYADRFGRVQDAFDTAGVMIDEVVGESGDDLAMRHALVTWVGWNRSDQTPAHAERWRGKGGHDLFQRDCASLVADMIDPRALFTADGEGTVLPGDPSPTIVGVRATPDVDHSVPRVGQI